MKIALYGGEDAPTPASTEVTWAQLVELLRGVEYVDCNPCPTARCRWCERQGLDQPHRRAHECGAKYCEAWSPVVIEGKRSKANVRAVTALVLDLDHVEPSALPAIGAALAPYDAVLHASHSDRPDSRSLRAVVRLSRDVLAAEWPRFFAAAVAHLGLPADPACKNLDRLYFLPTRPEGAGYAFAVSQGAPLDVDQVLSTATVVTTPALDVRRVAPRGAPLVLADLDEVHREAFSHLLSLPGDADSFRACAVLVWDWGLEEDEALPLLFEWSKTWSSGEEYATEEHFREKIANALAYCGKEQARGWKREELALSKWIYEKALRATPSRGPRDLGAAAAREGSEVDAFIDRAEAGTLFSITELSRALKTDQKTGALLNCPENIYYLLHADEAVAGCLRWDVMRRRVIARGGLFDGRDESVLSTAVRLWLSSRHGIVTKITDLEHLILLVARERPVDEVGDYLRSLEWDGVERASTWLERLAGAQLTQDDLDVSGYVRRVSAQWLTSAAARALAPGCQVDSMLVLEGQQSAGKTSLLRILAGEQFYACGAVDPGDKDGLQKITSSWIFEFGELEGMQRADLAALKSFLTTKVDRFRVPYGRAPEDFPRRGVFAGTTNDSEYLVDATGNRRFLPVRFSGLVDTKGLERERDQLWAEAVVRWRKHEEWCEAHPEEHPRGSPWRWWLEGEEREIAHRVTEERMVDDSPVTRIAAWWYGAAPASRPEFIPGAEVVTTVLGVPEGQVNRGLMQKVGQAMGKMGFKVSHRTIGGVRVRGYSPSAELRQAEQVKGSPAEVVRRLASPVKAVGSV